MKLIIPEGTQKWISVKDKLPKIPKGDYAVAVLVATYDSCYESLCRGYGYNVHEGMFGKRKKNELFKGSKKNDFIELYLGKDFYWGPTIDPVTHWMYLPKPPKYEYTEGELKKFNDSQTLKNI